MLGQGIPAFRGLLGDLHPVVLSIFNFSRVLECLCEEFTEVIVVGSVFEAKVSNISEVLLKLVREAFTEIFDSSCLLLLANLLVFLLVGGRLETLPW